MTLRFRQDNTEGYRDADLAALNAAFEEIMNANAVLWANDTSPGRDLAFKSWQDNVAEGLLFRYGEGRRGDGLLTTPYPVHDDPSLNDVQTQALIRELDEIIRNEVSRWPAGRAQTATISSADSSVISRERTTLQ
jgi:hypothetical protein